MATTPQDPETLQSSSFLHRTFSTIWNWTIQPVIDLAKLVTDTILTAITNCIGFFESLRDLAYAAVDLYRASIKAADAGQDAAVAVHRVAVVAEEFREVLPSKRDVQIGMAFLLLTYLSFKNRNLLLSAPQATIVAAPTSALSQNNQNSMLFAWGSYAAENIANGATTALSNITTVAADTATTAFRAIRSTL